MEENCESCEEELSVTNKILMVMGIIIYIIAIVLNNNISSVLSGKYTYN